MSALAPFPINPPPGVVITETDRVAEGRWIPPFDKVRFVHMRPQKMGGNRRVTSTAMNATARCTLAWLDFLQNTYIAAGTFSKLYAFDPAYNLTNITPIRSSGTLPSNPFTTASGSNTVTVTQIANLVSVGDTVIFAGATSFNGVTMNGTFIVNMLIDANDYTVTATTTATGSGTGGGSAVTYQYEINVGSNLGSGGLGWGAGPWGLGTWGTARGAITPQLQIEPRVWSLDHFGQILLATYNTGTLWAFDPTQGEPWPRAVSTFGGVPMNAPTNMRAMFVSPERFVFAMCEQMVVNVSSQGDPTTWTPALANTAFARTLQEGSKIVSGRAMAPFLSMVWTDSAAYIFQYTGSQFIYNSSLAGKDCGLIGPGAAVTVDGIAYWMGPNNFYFFNGAVQPLPNVEDIRQAVFSAIPTTLAFQCSAIYIAKYHEIMWLYPTVGATDPTNYVIFHLNDQCFSVGTLDFYSSTSGGIEITAGRGSGTHFSEGDTSPIMAGTDGYLYNHDPINDNFNDNGNPLTWMLTLSPYAVEAGMQNLDIEGIDWDFFDLLGTVTTTITTFDRLSLDTAMDTQTVVVPETAAGLTDYRVAGRYIQIELTSSDLGNYMRLGKPIVYARPSATRR
jgi:hypothetical protein